jgi:hypothetical protein
MAQFRKHKGSAKSDSGEVHTPLYTRLSAIISVRDEMIEASFSNPSISKHSVEKYKLEKELAKILLNYFVLVHEDYELVKVFVLDEMQKLVDSEITLPNPVNKTKFNIWLGMADKVWCIKYDFDRDVYLDEIENCTIFEEKEIKKQSKFKQLIQNIQRFI